MVQRGAGIVPVMQQFSKSSPFYTYTAASLLAGQNVNLEDILSNTLLEENVALAKYLREYEREMCLSHAGTVPDLEAEKYRAHLIQILLLHLNGPFSEASEFSVILHQRVEALVSFVSLSWA